MALLFTGGTSSDGFSSSTSEGTNWAASFWMRLISIGTNNGILNLDDGGGSDYCALAENNGVISIENEAGNSNILTLATDVWAHVYIQVSGGNASAGIRRITDSSYTTQTRSSVGVTSPADFLFGSFSPGLASYGCNCDIAAAKVWMGSTNLPTTTQLQGEGFTHRNLAPGVWALWPMVGDDVTACLQDISGNARTATEDGTLDVADGPPIAWSTAYSFGTPAPAGTTHQLTSTAAVTTTTTAPGPHRVRPITSTSATATTTVAALTYLTYALSGTTKDKDGVALGSCEVFLVQDNGDSTMSFLDHATSHATTGAYTFAGLKVGESSGLCVIAWKDDTPHVFDATDWVLTGVEE